MASNNSKYSEEMRERTARYILENGKSATSVAEEMGIDTNTVCRWVRDFRRKNNLPGYRESKGIRRAEPKTAEELVGKVKDLEKQVKAKDKEIEEYKEKIEILKKSLHIFMQPPG